MNGKWLNLALVIIIWFQLKASNSPLTTKTKLLHPDKLSPHVSSYCFLSIPEPLIFFVDWEFHNQSSVSSNESIITLCLNDIGLTVQTLMQQQNHMLTFAWEETSQSLPQKCSFGRERVHSYNMYNDECSNITIILAAVKKTQYQKYRFKVVWLRVFEIIIAFLHFHMKISDY